MATRKVVYNACYGGFTLSNQAKQLAYEKTKDIKWLEKYGYMRDKRHNSTLVEVVEELGKKASGMYSNLKIAEVEGPYRIDEYDGFESVETPDSYNWVE